MKTSRRSGVGVNKSTLGVNNVTSCLQWAVVHSPVSPTAATSHRILWGRRTGSVTDVICARRGSVHHVVVLEGKWHVPTKSTGSNPVTREMSSRVRCYMTLERILGGKNERVIAQNKKSKIWPGPISIAICPLCPPQRLEYSSGKLRVPSLDRYVR